MIIEQSKEMERSGLVIIVFRLQYSQHWSAWVSAYFRRPFLKFCRAFLVPALLKQQNYVSTAEFILSIKSMPKGLEL